MLNDDALLSPEVALLLACSRIPSDEIQRQAIRDTVQRSVNWELVATRAVHHGTAGVVGRNLAQIAPDLVPQEILDAFDAYLNYARERNRRSLDELVRVVEALATKGVAAIPLRGPTLAIQAYGDIGARVFGGVDLLLRDDNLRSAITVLLELGYAREPSLTDAQFSMIHYLRGHEPLVNKAASALIELHTSLTSAKTALDIDYRGFWRRAKAKTTVTANSILMLAPEDMLLTLAMHGGNKMWGETKWVADIAAFIASHPHIDWGAVHERARSQGCVRIVRLGLALASAFAGARIPPEMASAVRQDRMVAPMIRRIVTRWSSEEPVRPSNNEAISWDHLLLHDGILRRGRYLARTVLLPAISDIPGSYLPPRLAFAYLPMKLSRAGIVTPVQRVYRTIVDTAARAPNYLTGHDLLSWAVPMSPNMRRSYAHWRHVRAAATLALKEDPNKIAAWEKLGDAMLGLRRYEEALAAFDAGIVLEPENPPLVKKHHAIVRQLRDAGKIQYSGPPRDLKDWLIRAGLAWTLSRLTDVSQACDQALAIDPGNLAAARLGIHARLHACDWTRRGDDCSRVSEGLHNGELIIKAINHRALCDSEAELRLCAELTARRTQSVSPALWSGARDNHTKLRVAYLSSDFGDHPVAYQIAGLFERHDKSKFEVTGIFLNRSDGSHLHQRLADAFDRTLDVSKMSDDEAAARLREAEIDILVDLNGYTWGRRTGILARRPAPVQAHYVGYPGMMESPFIDYIIGDDVVIPRHSRMFYQEKVVYLPNCYLPADNRQEISSNRPTRKLAGLPETAFVFACFNAAYKITPDVFDVWMKLLRSAEDSILWLRSDNPDVMRNLRREAALRAVAPERIVFAQRVPDMRDHLARLRLADVFVDTLPYNAHATACAALWTGLPVVTCIGGAFAGRVGASLLKSVGLPELIAGSLEEYEQLVLSLATNPARLTSIKAKLIRHRDTAPLFDTERFTRDLEGAYSAMWERHQLGLPPGHLAVLPRD